MNLPYLHLDPADSTPIWSQIERGLRRLVVSGQLPPETLVPSVRQLARQLTVNPATVAKAYRRLVDSGLLAVRRGEGTYVAATVPGLPGEERRLQLAEGALRYATHALTLGAPRAETREALDHALDDLGEQREDR